jgi:hypothetical protein
MAQLLDRQLFLQRIKSRVGQGYIYGAYFDRLITEAYIQAKAKQFPGQYSANYIQRSRKWIGKYAGDCIGLIKGAYWTDDSGKITYKYLGRADKSANGTLALATVKGNIATMPDIPGLFVHFNGHIGVYIGGGEVIEARGVDYGVVVTRLKDRPWTSWGQVPYVDYSEDVFMEKIYQGVPKGLVATGLWQTILVALGYDLGSYGPNGDGVDESFGPATAKNTIQFKKDNGMSYTTATETVVDSGVYKAAVAALKAKQGNVSADALEAVQAEAERLEAQTKTLAAKAASLQAKLDDVTGIKNLLEKDLKQIATAKKIIDKY